MANATSSGSIVDKAFAARQVFRFRKHLLDKDPTSKKLALLDNVDPGHRFLRHLGWDKTGAGGEEAWRRTWENSPAGVGQFGSWVSGPFKRWRDEWAASIKQPGGVADEGGQGEDGVAERQGYERPKADAGVVAKDTGGQPPMQMQLGPGSGDDGMTSPVHATPTTTDAAALLRRAKVAPAMTTTTTTNDVTREAVATTDDSPTARHRARTRSPPLPLAPMPAMVPVRVRSIEHSIEAGRRAAAAAEKDRDKVRVEEEDGLLLQNPDSLVMRTLRLTISDEHLQDQRQQQQPRIRVRPSARGDEGGGGGGAQVAPRLDEHGARVKTWSDEDRRRLGQFYQWYRTVLRPSVSEERGGAC